MGVKCWQGSSELVHNTLLETKKNPLGVVGFFLERKGPSGDALYCV
jgi:hypothetical protein